LFRDTYDFDGYVVCDCGGIQSIMTRHNYTSTIPDTVAAALHAGVDLDCGSFYNTNIPIAFANKTISETDIDQALSRVFNVLLRLGYFDPPEMQPYRNLSRIDIGTHQAQQLAFVSAQQSLVLLTLSGRLLEARVLKILFLYIRSLLTMDIVKIQLRTLRS